MCITPWTVRFAISAAHSCSSKYSEVNGSVSKAGPRRASRRSSGSRPRRLETLEPSPAVGLIPAKQLAELPTKLPQCARGRGKAFRRVGRGEPLHQEREIVWSTGRRQRPNVLESKVRDDLLDSPTLGGVRDSWELHARYTVAHIYGSVYYIPLLHARQTIDRDDGRDAHAPTSGGSRRDCGLSPWAARMRFGSNPLPKRLGVTKGGFYGYFSDRRGAARRRCSTPGSERFIDEVIERVEGEGGDARARLRRLFALASASAGELLKVELAIRDWARRDKAVAKRLSGSTTGGWNTCARCLRDFCETRTMSRPAACSLSPSSSAATSSPPITTGAAARMWWSRPWSGSRAESVSKSHPRRWRLACFDLDGTLVRLHVRKPASGRSPRTE